MDTRSPHSYPLPPDCHRFLHKAMATVFEVVIAETDQLYAHQAAQAAFDELDRLELLLSRYIENSDISRINNAVAGDAISIGPEAFACLKHCAEIYAATAGVFDITAGTLLNCWRNPDKSPRQPTPEEIDKALSSTALQHLILAEDAFTVILKNAPLTIDLGGYGKGYSLDCIVDLFAEWEIENYLIHGGSSTVLAHGSLPDGKDGWPISLSHPHRPDEILFDTRLSNYSFSGSGLVKGQHIIDPRTGYPVDGQTTASWSLAPTAALSDALSTAFMIMSPEEVAFFCEIHPETGAMLIAAENENDTTSANLKKIGRFQTIA